MYKCVSIVIFLLLISSPVRGEARKHSDNFESIRVGIKSYEEYMEAFFLIGDVDSFEKIDAIEDVEKELLNNKDAITGIRRYIEYLSEVKENMDKVYYSDEGVLDSFQSCDLNSIRSSVSFQLRHLKELESCIKSKCDLFPMLTKISGNASRAERQIKGCKTETE